MLYSGERIRADQDQARGWSAMRALWTSQLCLPKGSSLLRDQVRTCFFPHSCLQLFCWGFFVNQEYPESLQGLPLCFLSGMWLTALVWRKICAMLLYCPITSHFCTIPLCFLMLWHRPRQGSSARVGTSLNLNLRSREIVLGNCQLSANWWWSELSARKGWGQTRQLRHKPVAHPCLDCWITCCCSHLSIWNEHLEKIKQVDTWYRTISGFGISQKTERNRNI